VVENTLQTPRPDNGRGIGVFGGTFDPVHVAHLRMALEMREQLQLDEVRLVPSHRPPHRAPPLASAQHRLAMLQLAVKDCEGLIVDDRELRRDTPSYMVDTLQSLRDEVGGDKVIVLGMGADAFAGLTSWHRWQQLFELANIAVFDRPGADRVTDKSLLQQIDRRRVDEVSVLQVNPRGMASHGKIAFLAANALDVSATSLRAIMAAGRSPQFLISDSVADYISQHGLYRAAANEFSNPSNRNLN
jgi:nicotinate-nucleotide adenylyltransferase